MSTYFIHNSRITKTGTAVILPESRGLRFGEGFFETIKVIKGIIVLKSFHFERIQKSFQVLGFEFSKQINLDIIELKINQLLIKNDHLDQARVRLMFIRKGGGLNDNVSNIPDYTIESYPLSIEDQLNINGLELIMYKDIIKSCDQLSNIKSNNFLPYVMAAKYASLHKVNDAVLLNMHGRVCDTSIANIFIIKGQTITTPALTEGCIAGVMRRHIIENIVIKYKLLEAAVTTEDLLNADEVFLTNAIKGIRWVKSIGDKTYSRKIVRDIFSIFNKTI